MCRCTSMEGVSVGRELFFRGFSWLPPSEENGFVKRESLAARMI